MLYHVAAVHGGIWQAPYIRTVIDTYMYILRTGTGPITNISALNADSVLHIQLTVMVYAIVFAILAALKIVIDIAVDRA